jgi:hypothetical protein
MKSRISVSASRVRRSCSSAVVTGSSTGARRFRCCSILSSVRARSSSRSPMSRIASTPYGSSRTLRTNHS